MSPSNSTALVHGVAAAFWKTLSGLAALHTPSPEVISDVLMEHLRARGLRVVEDDRKHE